METPAGRVAREFYDASWLEHQQKPDEPPPPKPKPRPPDEMRHLQETYDLYEYRDWNAEVPPGYKRVEINFQNYIDIADICREDVIPLYQMTNDTNDEESLIPFKYLKKWSMFIRYCINVRSDRLVPKEDDTEQRTPRRTIWTRSTSG